MKSFSFFTLLFGKKNADILWEQKAWRLGLLFFVIASPFIFSFLHNSSLFFLIVLFFIFLVIALFSPRSIFILMLISAPFEILNFLPQESPLSLRPYQFFASVVFVGLLLRGVHTFSIKKYREFLPINFVDIGVVLIIFGGFFSAFFSPFFQESFRLSIILFSFAFIYALTRWFVGSGRDIALSMPYLIASFVSTVLYALIQNIAFLYGEGWHKEIMPGRPNAFFSEPDWLGFYGALFLFVLWFFFFSIERKKEEKISEGMMLVSLWIASTFGFMALIITVSRSAWLGLFFGVSFLVLWSIWRQREQTVKKIFFLVLSFCVALTYVIVVPLTNFELGNRAQSSISGLQEITISCLKKENLPLQISSENDLAEYNCRHISLEEREEEKASGRYITKVLRKDPNAEIRKDIWRKTEEIIRENFLFGIGWGGISSAFGEGSRGEYFNASNIFLGVWLGSGLIGLGGLIMLFVYLAYFSIRSSLSKEKGISKIGIALFGTLGVVFVFSMFNSSEFLAIMWIWLGMIGFLLPAIRKQKDMHKKHLSL